MKDLYKTIEEELQMIVPVVQRVHGKEHPEFYEVKELYDELHKNIDDESYDFKPIFTKLQSITDDYKIPGDVCGTYEKVYNSLEALDKEYNG